MVNRDGHHLGPFTHDQACYMLAEGKLQAWDLCWLNGSRDWIALEQIPGVSKKTDALRQQRRAEAIASSQDGPTQPNPQFVVTSGTGNTHTYDPGPVPQSPRNWMRIGVWIGVVVTLITALVVWMFFLNDEVLIKNIERRADNLTYLKGETIPYTGMVHKYFDDDTLWETVNYIKGLREGERKVWHINGNVALNEKYQNGHLTIASSFNFQGVPSGDYESGRGKLTLYFNHSGKRNEELEYEGGQISKRTIWDHNGNLIAMIPPALPPNMAEYTGPTLPSAALPGATTPDIPTPITPTNTIPTVVAPTHPPTNTNVEVVNPQIANPKSRGRLTEWRYSVDNRATARNIRNRIDLLYLGKQYTAVYEFFGWPDEDRGADWVYKDLTVKNISSGGYFSRITFRYRDGIVIKIIAEP
ncbi:MAG: DUF4339 domain-containing protein [Verrucomicrobiales bacterium]|nr:DUF4339 domain-containing protein [Verrucomicrobiales bacterium]